MMHARNFIVVVVLLLPVLTSSYPQSGRWKEMYERLQAAESSGQQNQPKKPGYVCCNQPANRPTLPPYLQRPFNKPGNSPSGGLLTLEVAAPAGNMIDSSQPVMPQAFPYGRHFNGLQAVALSLDNADTRTSLLRRALEQLVRLQHQQQRAPASSSSSSSSSSQDGQLLNPAHLLPHSPGLDDRYSLHKQGDLLSRLLGPQAAVPSQSEPLNIQLTGARKRGGGFVARRSSKGGAPGSAGGPNIGSCPSDCRVCYKTPHGGGYVWRCSR